MAKATLQTTNPEARVGGSLLGGEYHEVVVNSVIKGSHVLPRQHGKLKTLSDCVGQSIAWPHLNVYTRYFGCFDTLFSIDAHMIH